jgi:hypothetical protein
MNGQTRFRLKDDDFVFKVKSLTDTVTSITSKKGTK